MAVCSSREPNSARLRLEAVDAKGREIPNGVETVARLMRLLLHMRTYRYPAPFT